MCRSREIKVMYIVCASFFLGSLSVRAAIVHSAAGTKRVDLTLFDQPITAQRHDEPMSAQFCSSGDAMYAVGRSFAERCRRCQCLEGGRKECVRVSRSSACPDDEVHTNSEHSCIQWTDDGCCCLRHGCLSQGRVYEPNTTLPMNPSQPCQIHLCDPDTGQIRTRHKVCPRMCVDGVLFPGVCCAVCPNGANCRLPRHRYPELTSVQDTLTHPNSQLFPAGLDADSGRSLLCHCVFPGRTATCTYIQTRPQSDVTPGSTPTSSRSRDSLLAASPFQPLQRPPFSPPPQPQPLPAPPTRMMKESKSLTSQRTKPASHLASLESTKHEPEDKEQIQNVHRIVALPSEFTQERQSSGRSLPSSIRKTPNSSHPLPNSFRKTSSSSQSLPNSLRKTSSSSQSLPNSVGKTSSSSQSLPNSVRKTSSSSQSLPNSVRKTSSSSQSLPNSDRKTASSSQSLPNVANKKSSSPQPLKPTQPPSQAQPKRKVLPMLLEDFAHLIPADGLIIL